MSGLGPFCSLFTPGFKGVYFGLSALVYGPWGRVHTPSVSLSALSVWEAETLMMAEPKVG